MKKVIFSWVGTNHDFLERNTKGEMVKSENPINENGPHVNLYKDFLDFDIHYLLSQYDGKGSKSLEGEFLANELRQRFKKEVVLKFMSLSDITNVGEIKNKVEDLIEKELDHHHVEIFISPGTPAMQTAWYLIGSERASRENLRLFKRRERKSVDNVPPKEYLEFQATPYARVTNLREKISQAHPSDKTPFITDSLKEVYHRAYQVAGNYSTTVLIEGETGTGKEYLARYIHDNSHRKEQPYVAINCGAFRGDLLESRLFGYLKGSFSGAIETRKGAFEDAHGGTIFLDEIGDVTPRMQVALLRVLEEKKISKIGSTEEIEVDVRIIAASNKNLWKLCQEGTFRYDLYYRLAIAELRIPSFREFGKRERKEWISYYFEKLYVPLEKRYLAKISHEAWNFLLSYPFPGNLRELRNAIETIYTFCEGEVTLDDIPRRLRKEQHASLKLKDITQSHVKSVVSFCDGNISEASRIMDINPATVRKYLE
jgi:transcriptional regulator of acetoin/glycerol metabolism